MVTRRLRARFAALAILLAAATLAGWATYRHLRSLLVEPHPFGAAAAELRIEVAPGETTRVILERLERVGVLRSALVARVYHSRVLGDPPLQAGQYRFVSPVAAVEVLRRLRVGDVVTYPVTIVEGWTFVETAEALARAGLGSREALVAELSSPARVRDLDPQAATLEGFLFPDTYRFPRGVSPAAIADALVTGFRRAWQRDVLPLRFIEDRRSLRELVILASLVEKEARREEERALVAAVYANRLARGIGLYADPTIIYGLKLAGRWDGDLRRRDLEEDSPWNSYRRPGLPPGPICSPGAASLAAAARPAAVDYLYFVSRNDGTHVFAESLAEHNRNVELWQRRYFRERRRSAPR